MKVAFQIDQLGFAAPGGIGTYVWELLLAFMDAAPEEVLPFHAPFAHGSPPLAIPTRSGKLGVELRIPARYSYPGWTYAGLPPLPRSLGACDAVHITNPAGIPRVRRRQKLVVTVHDLAFEHFPEAFPPRWLRLYRAGLRAVGKRADAVITPSRATADDLLSRTDIDPSKVHVTPLASSRGKVNDHEEPSSALRVPRPFILCASTIEPRKNQVRLVRAYRKIAGSVPHSLVLAGPNGWRHDDLDAELATEGLGTVIRTGRLDDWELDALYRDADAVAYPSLYEGFGLPVIEAMERGVPVVASTTPAVAETAGDAALLVDPEDVDALAGALERVLTDAELAADLRARGLARSAGFSWEATARATLDVYRQAIGAS